MQTPLQQHVWHGYYIDALAMTWYDADMDGANIDELYFTHDANFNVTALLGDTGAVQERYEYETYGHPAILDADFSDDADGLSDWEHDVLFAGYQYDADAAVYHVRNRVYQPALGRWSQRDPAGYVDGGSLYEYTTSTPVRFTDPSGLTPPEYVPKITGSGVNSSGHHPKRIGTYTDSLHWIHTTTHGDLWAPDVDDDLVEWAVAGFENYILATNDTWAYHRIKFWPDTKYELKLTSLIVLLCNCDGRVKWNVQQPSREDVDRKLLAALVLNAVYDYADYPPKSVTFSFDMVSAYTHNGGQFTVSGGINHGGKKSGWGFTGGFTYSFPPQNVKYRHASPGSLRVTCELKNGFSK